MYRIKINNLKTCSVYNCQNISLVKINKSIKKYCFKHIDFDLYNHIYKIEKKNFHMSPNHDLILNSKIKLTSYNKFIIFKNDVKELVNSYKRLVSDEKYKLYIKKYILFKEYLKYLNSIKIDKKNILSNGLKLKKYSFSENIEITYNFGKCKSKIGYFFKDYRKSKDLIKIEKKLLIEDFNNYSKSNNFYSIFSKDIENLIFKYYYYPDNNFFEDNYFKRIRFILDFDNLVIFYKMKKNNKNKFIILS